MKRFDLANEVAKQLITIASAIITVLVAFYEKFFSHEDWIFILVFVVLLIFILSILIGVLSIGGLTTLVESQEHNEWLRTNPPPTGTPHAEFSQLDGSSAQRLARWQQILFSSGLLLFIVVSIADRYFFGAHKATC